MYTKYIYIYIYTLYIIIFIYREREICIPGKRATPPAPPPSPLWWGAKSSVGWDRALWTSALRRSLRTDDESSAWRSD